MSIVQALGGQLWFNVCVGLHIASLLIIAGCMLVRLFMHIHDYEYEDDDEEEEE